MNTELSRIPSLGLGHTYQSTREKIAASGRTERTIVRSADLYSTRHILHWFLTKNKWKHVINISFVVLTSAVGHTLADQQASQERLASDILPSLTPLVKNLLCTRCYAVGQGVSFDAWVSL